jgi:hypothetical protein
MIITMNDQNEFVTKRTFHEGMEHLEAKIDIKIDALALATQQEFTEVHERFDVVEKRIAGIEERMATKQDLFLFENRVLAAIGAIAAEIKNHNVRLLALERIVKP